MRTIVFLFLALALRAGEPTQNIRGVVLDPSGRPIGTARIQCGDRVSFTNVEGRFSVPGDTCDARIEKGGFTPITSRLTTASESKIVLPVQGPLENVIVSATRMQTTPEQAAVSANTIDAQQLQLRDSPSIQDVLRELPDLSIVTNGRPGDQTSLFTRGSSSTSTLVLLDGVPLNDPGGQINLAHLTSNGIDRVEVVRGPESALFGAEASAGVVQIFTKRGDPENAVPHGSFEYERGNFGTDRWLAGLTGGFKGRLDYSLYADQLHTAGAVPNDFYRNDSGSANIGYRLSNATQLRGIFRIYDAHLGVPGQDAYRAYDFATNEETRDESVAARIDDSRGSHYFQTFSFGYHHLHDVFNENEDFRSQDLAALVRDAGSRTYFVQLLNPAALPSQIPSGTRIAPATAFFGPYGSLNIAARKTADYQGTFAHSSGALVFGYSFQDQTGNISGTSASRTHNGIFINEHYSLGGRIYLNGGVRLEHSSVFGTYSAPRGGASFLLWKDRGPLSSLFLRLSAGRGIQEPSLYENFVRTPYAIGNPALRPEKTNSYEVALVEEWWGHRLRSEVTAFRSSFENLITYVYPSWENIEKSWARGVEFSTETKLLRNISLTASYTRLYTRIVNSVTPTSNITGIGQQLLRRPRNGGSVVLSAAPRRFTLLMGARFVGERQDSDYTFGITRNPNYENVFLSASYSLSRHFTPVLRLDNLLNERYEEALGYAALSRSILGGLRISW